MPPSAAWNSPSLSWVAPVTRTRAQGLDDWLWSAHWFSLHYKANASDSGVTNVIDEDGAVNELGRAFVEERMDRIENLA